jgi:general secretion pathway protein K
MTATPAGSSVDSPANQSRAAESGFILITTVWLLLLLSLIGATALSLVTLRAKSRAHAVRTAELVSLADGIIELTAYQLVTRQLGARSVTHLSLDATSFSCMIEHTGVTIQVVDTAGLIDLNAASPELIEKLFLGTGVSPTAAASIATAVVDFRDADDSERVGGAKRATYLVAGMKHGPKNGIFDSVDELDQVLGVTREVFERTRIFWTVYSRLPNIDASVAPATLLEILSQPQNAGRRAPIDRATLAAQPLFSARTTARNFVVRVTAQASKLYSAQREATIELTPRSAHGVRKLDTRSVFSQSSQPHIDLSVPCPGWPQN